MRKFELNLETRNVINKTNIVIESYNKKLIFLIEFTESEVRSITLFPGRESSMNIAKGAIKFLLDSENFDEFLEEGGDIEDLGYKIKMTFGLGLIPINILPKFSFILSSSKFENEVYNRTSEWIIDEVEDEILAAHLINELQK